MSSEAIYTPEESASVALVRWSGAVAEQVGEGDAPAVLLRRAREDAALAAFGDFLPDVPAAESLFREGVNLYLAHQKAGTEGDAFFGEFSTKLEALVPGAAGVTLGQAGPITAEGFWPRLEQRIDAARRVFVAPPSGSVLSDERRQNAAMVTAAVVAAGELVGRGRASLEAVLPVRLLERMPTIGDMRTTAVPGRCASVYARAMESVTTWQHEAEGLCARVGNTTTAQAIAPILVSARGPLALSEFKEASGKSRNTAETFLEQLRAKGMVAAVTGERGKAYAFLRSAAQVARGRDVAPGPGRDAAALPPDSPTSEHKRARGR